jgi:tryptophan-rich hypothetical protein
MNPINPRKLKGSKWTAMHPKNKEKHFVVTEVEYDEDGAVVECILQAIMTQRESNIDWYELKDPTRWRQGWK